MVIALFVIYMWIHNVLCFHEFYFQWWINFVTLNFCTDLVLLHMQLNHSSNLLQHATCQLLKVAIWTSAKHSAKVVLIIHVPTVMKQRVVVVWTQLKVETWNDHECLEPDAYNIHMWHLSCHRFYVHECINPIVANSIINLSVIPCLNKE